MGVVVVMVSKPRPCQFKMADEKTEEASVAEARPRRAQAGRNIGKLIDQELDGDDFYKSAYGGFGEESEDEEYEVGCQVF